MSGGKTVFYVPHEDARTLGRQMLVAGFLAGLSLGAAGACILLAVVFGLRLL